MSLSVCPVHLNGIRDHGHSARMQASKLQRRLRCIRLPPSPFHRRESRWISLSFSLASVLVLPLALRVIRFPLPS